MQEAQWPSGLMGKASDSGVRGCGFESYMGHVWKVNVKLVVQKFQR